MHSLAIAEDTSDDPEGPVQALLVRGAIVVCA
jgi:hypothetical protein